MSRPFNCKCSVFPAFFPSAGGADTGRLQCQEASGTHRLRRDNSRGEAAAAAEIARNQRDRDRDRCARAAANRLAGDGPRAGRAGQEAGGEQTAPATPRAGESTSDRSSVGVV